MISRFFKVEIPMIVVLEYVFIFNLITNWFTNDLPIVEALVKSFSFTLGVFTAFFLIFAVGELLNRRKK